MGAFDGAQMTTSTLWVRLATYCSTFS